MTTGENPPDFSVIVPVYQSADSVAELVRRVTALFDEKLHQSFEIILIDDGSARAQTWEMLTRLAGADARVRSIRLMRNYGKPSAVLCGFTQMRGNWAVTIDDDLQQSPEDIAALIAFKDHDVVVATYREKKHSRIVTLTSWIKGLFDARVLNLPFRMSPLKLIRRRTVDQMLKMRPGRPYIPALLAHVTSDFKAVPLEHHPSQAGKSRYNFFRRLRQFSNLIISNSGFFARIWAVAGLGLGLAGLAGLFGLLLAWMLGAEPGGTSLVLATLLTIGGMILMALGVVGEYLIRLVELTSARPPFVIRDIVSGPGSDPGASGASGSDGA